MNEWTVPQNWTAQTLLFISLMDSPVELKIEYDGFYTITFRKRESEGLVETIEAQIGL